MRIVRSSYTFVREWRVHDISEVKGSNERISILKKQQK